MFNTDKCKGMHIGTSNSNVCYVIGGKTMEKVDEEKELGVIISDLKVLKQYKISGKHR